MDDKTRSSDFMDTGALDGGVPGKEAGELATQQPPKAAAVDVEPEPEVTPETGPVEDNETDERTDARGRVLNPWETNPS